MRVTSPIRTRASLVLRAFVLALPILCAVWQTSCWVYVSDCDDDDYCDDDFDDDDFDDDDFDDDDDGRLSGGGAPDADGAAGPSRSIADSGLRLRTFELIAEGGDASAHPVRRIVAIEGIAIGMAAGVEEAAAEVRPDEAAFRAFTGLLIAENQDLIGLPSTAGRWVFDGVEFSTEETRVHYRQELRPLVHSAFLGRETGALTFVFDRRGSLVEIDNSARLRFD